MDGLFIGWLKEYGYVILYLWCILEGEMGLVMGGIMSHTGDMSFFLSIFVAGLGGFTGDQIYFYIGRYNKALIQRKLHNQRRKFAIAHLLLRKYGWPIIFM
jgi:membrane protein DedA with SNARE-associated domain